MKTCSISSRSLLALAAGALLALAAGCQSTPPKTPSSPGPHQNSGVDGKDMPAGHHRDPHLMGSPGPHQ